jgi:glycosyltransferase involved in cell wall biosynthesis
MPNASNPLSVTLSLVSQPYQRSVADRLQHDGALQRLLIFQGGVEVFDPDGVEGLNLVRRFRHYRLINRLLWAAWRRVPRGVRMGNMPLTASMSYADRLASRWVPPTAIFHGCSGYCLACIGKARQYGSIVMIEQVAMHPSDWQRAVLDECEAFGVRPRECRSILPAPLIQRMEHEFDLADAIVVPSQIARRSFERAGHGQRAVAVHAGADHRFFAPAAEAPSRSIFRVCYAGRVELPKGVPYLLQAWKQLNLPCAELVVLGEVTPEMSGIIRQWALPNVRFLGHQTPLELAKWFRASHLFVFPSVNEGLARVLFEAMSSGLPVIATEQSGAEDCITPGVQGNVIPARNVAALAESILWHFQNPEESAAMGKAARSRIERQFTIPHYVERVIKLYRAAAGKSTEAAGRIDYAVSG